MFKRLWFALLLPPLPPPELSEMSSEGKEDDEDEEDICEGDVRLSSELCGELQVVQHMLLKIKKEETVASSSENAALPRQRIQIAVELRATRARGRGYRVVLTMTRVIVIVGVIVMMMVVVQVIVVVLLVFLLGSRSIVDSTAGRWRLDLTAQSVGLAIV